MSPKIPPKVPAKTNYCFSSRNIGIYKQIEFTHENNSVYVFIGEGDGESSGDIPQTNPLC